MLTYVSQLLYVRVLYDKFCKFDYSVTLFDYAYSLKLKYLDSSSEIDNINISSHHNILCLFVPSYLRYCNLVLHKTIAENEEKSSSSRYIVENCVSQFSSYKYRSVQCIGTEKCEMKNNSEIKEKKSVPTCANVFFFICLGDFCL